MAKDTWGSDTQLPENMTRAEIAEENAMRARIKKKEQIAAIKEDIAAIGIAVSRLRHPDAKIDTPAITRDHKRRL